MLSDRLDDPEYVRLVERLIKRRHDLGLNQIDANTDAGLSDNHIARLERRASCADIITLQRWATALGYRVTLQSLPVSSTWVVVPPPD